MALTSRSSRSNGIPTTTSVTNTPNEDGTYTRTTAVIYGNGTEITTKQILTALEIEQLENPSYSTSHHTHTLPSSPPPRYEYAPPTLLDAGTSPSSPSSPSLPSSTLSGSRDPLLPQGSTKTSTSSLSSGILSNRKSDSPLSHYSTLLILFSFLCAIITKANMGPYDEKSLSGSLSFLCSLFAIPMMYNLGSNFKTKDKDDCTESQQDDDGNVDIAHEHTWFLQWISGCAWTFYVFSIIYWVIAILLYSEGISPWALDFTILGTLWNIMTFFIMMGRTEYLRRKKRNDAMYNLFNTYSDTYAKSIFLFGLSMMSGYTCAVAMMMVVETNGEAVLAFLMAVMLIVYLSSSNGAFLLMHSEVNNAPKANDNDKSAGVEEAEPLVVPSDVKRAQPRSGVICVSNVLYAVGILFDLIVISIASHFPLHGIVIFVLVSYNAIPWLLYRETI